MSTDTLDSSLPIFNDPAVPADDLLGAGATAVIESALDAVDATVERVTPAQTTYYPGRSLTVRHEVRVLWPDASRTDESIVLASGRKPPREALKVSDGEREIIVWRAPHDPWLPGMAPAMSPTAMSALFDQLGLPSTDLRTKLRAYRPGRRAVVEVTGPRSRAFLKVVPTRSVEKLHRQHEALAGQVPVPASLGWSEEHGIVVLQALPGRTLRQAMFAGFGLPGAGALLATLDRLPEPDADLVAKAEATGVDWRAHEFADVVGNVAPELDRRVLALADGIRPFEAIASDHEVVAVHGDFYEAQLLVDGGRITGLLDVDTFGAGRRVDDLSTMIGHLSVLALGSPRRQSIERYAVRLLDRFDKEVDPAVLRAGVAGVVLGLATGPFRVLEPNWLQHTEARVALAERWLDSARRVG